MILVGVILGYLFGSLLFSVIIGKYCFHLDPREFASKNAGATNSSRVFGKKVGIIVLILDVIKCIIPVIIMWSIANFAIQEYLYQTYYFDDNSLIFITSFAALLGHCFPIFFRFKGGKAASSLGAFVILSSPWITLICLLIWITIILIWKYVSLASIITPIIAIFLYFVPGINWVYLLGFKINDLLIINGNNIFSIVLIVSFFILSSCLLIYRHRANIARLINHQERKINLIPR